MNRLSVRALCVAGAAALVTGGVAAPAAHAAQPANVVKPATVTYTLVTEPGDTYTPIYNMINSATSTIDMTMYELTDTTAEQDLANAAARGVTVRVILDQNREKTNNTTAYNFLTGHGVQVHWAWTTYAATHQKTVTIDGTKTAIMSGNLTSQYYSTSRDFAVIENNSYDVAAIEKVFNADFTNTAITPTDGSHLVWSPTDSQAQILPIINNATTSLSIENEEMAYPTVTTALENAAKRGVNVEVTMTNDANDYATEFDALVAAGVHVHTYAYTASLYIHAKVVLADYGTANQILDVGSQNFSNASWNENRELGFITNLTSNASLISSVNSTVASDYAGGTNWT
jgi:cardiolipin synthase A/B